MAIVGIDLGTSNSLVSVWRDSGAEALPNLLGETLTPSAISIADDGAILVGRAALDLLITHPDRSVASFKRAMGSNTVFTLANRPWRAEELSALVLKSLKQDAETALGEAVEEAIISVPAYFNDVQRKATLDAAMLAGLKVERLINEPTAAALAHGLENVGEGTFLVLDLGGGTFDVSILEKYDDVMEIRASAGDSLLGGDDFRDVLARMVATRHDFSPEKLARTDLARLMLEAERMKRELTANQTCSYQLQVEGRSQAGSLTREDFEEAAQPLLRRIRAPIERAIRDARIEVASIDQIVLVGGAARMPMLRSLAIKLFGKFPLLHPAPDHIVGLGAAIQAGLKSRASSLREIVMTDVCPFSLGTSVLDMRSPEGASFSPIIERNAIVPISRVNRYFTAHNGQTRIDLDVFQGESLRISQNIKIGDLTLPVPPGPAGQEAIDVRFTYDINGALEVEVTVVSTGAKHQRIFRNQSSLSDAELASRFAALEAIKILPREQQENRRLIAWAERLYAENLGPAREHIRELLSRFEEAILDQTDRNPAELRASFANALRQFETSTF